jgi:hypothetical protein
VRTDRSGVLPLRPLTIAELLDAAVALLRTRAGRLLGAGVAVAFAEQAALWPLRRAADVDISYLPGSHRVAPYLLMLALGFTTEPLAIAVLGGIASDAAPSALLGRSAPVRDRPILLRVCVAGVLAAALCGLCWLGPALYGWLGRTALLGLVAVPLWPVMYGLVGLTVPAVVIEGRNPFAALGRSIRLSVRSGLRVVGVRVLGYLAWLLIRLVLGIGGVAALSLVIDSPSPTVDNLLMGFAWLVVNGLAYPTLACLDAALLLEIRMRTEGLDIWLSRVLARGVSAGPALAVPQ